MKDPWKVNCLIAGVAGIAWVASFLLNERFLPIFNYAPGIDLIFIPSGVRLFAIMIGGIWAAFGVAVGSLVLAGREFSTSSLTVVLAIAAGSGLFPYLALRSALKMTGVKASLTNLSPVHLPFISLGVAVVSSLLHNILFCTAGLEPWSALPARVLAMATGDFLGILLAVLAAFLVLRAYRRPVS